MRVLVVDESEERAAILREGLAMAGHEVAASLSSPLELLRMVQDLQPDVIVIDTESLTRDVLEHLVIVSQSSPRPIVMFAADSGGEAIREAVRAGVSAYIVDGLDARRVNSIVQVACARFEEFQRLKAELAEANLKLAERKLVERVKGLLMHSRGMSEDDAYHALRKLAMSKKNAPGRRRAAADRKCRTARQKLTPLPDSGAATHHCAPQQCAYWQTTYCFN